MATPITSKTSVATCGGSDPKYLDKLISVIDGNIVIDMLKSIQDKKKKTRR